MAADTERHFRPNVADMDAMVAWAFSTRRFVDGAPARYGERLGLSPGLAQRAERDMLHLLALFGRARRDGDFWIASP